VYLEVAGTVCGCDLVCLGRNGTEMANFEASQSDRYSKPAKDASMLLVSSWE